MDTFPGRAGQVRVSYRPKDNMLIGVLEDQSLHHLMTKLNTPAGNAEARQAYEAKDYARARGLFWGACQAGNARSCFELGSMYDTGVGGYRNGAMARRYYQQGCVRGSPKACEMAEGMAGRDRATADLAVSPLRFKDRGATQGLLECACPAQQSRGPVYGTDIYTDDSSICRAAVHAGIVDPAVRGAVRVEGIAGVESYRPSVRHGVSSQRRDAWPRAFRFVADADTSATPPGRPEASAPAGASSSGALPSSARPAAPAGPRSVASAPPPDPPAPRERCSLDAIAGTYKTSHGPLVCKAAGAGLQCCYGGACERRVELAFDESDGNLVGTWIYPNGTWGPVIFPISSQCALQSGRWGSAGRNPDRAWGVAGR